MPRPNRTMLRIGDWCVNPACGEISRNGETVRLEARTMRLLLCLAQHAGEVVSIDDLLDQVWSGVIVSPDSVYQAVASLRRQLGDDSRDPAYIATVPRLGYRMVAAVIPPADNSSGDGPSLKATDQSLDSVPRLASGPVWAVAALCFGLVILSAMLLAARFHSKVASANRPTASTLAQESIAVLPFLDLTQGMTQEEFADGMTEELIDKLSHIPGLLVPSPTSSFYFKGKQIPVADIAKSLGVSYVLDGSVRKSGARVRIAARLIHPCNGYVVWSETYDRPWNDALMVQDDIAGEVTKALRASIQAENPPAASP